MLSFTQLVIIYSLIFIALYFVIGYLEKKLVINGLVKTNKYLGKALAIVVITVFMLLATLYWIENPNSYPNPDTYAYRKGIDLVYSSSRLPGEGSYDPYYVRFPIYVLIGAVVAITTDLSSTFSLIISQSAFTLLFLMILLRLLRGRWEMFIITTLLILSNPYLSGYLKILIPQVAGLTVLSLLLLLTLNVNKRNWLIILIILLPLGLIHFAVLPLLVIVLSTYLIVVKTVARTSLHKGDPEKNNYMYAITLLSLLTHSIYIGYAYDVHNLTNYINYYLYLLTKIFIEPSEAIQGVLEGVGLPRGYLILNALGPAVFSATTLYYMFSAMRNFRSKVMELTLYLLGVLIVGIGILRYYFATEIPSMSIARYLNVYGFSLLTIASTLVFSKTKISKLFYYTLLATLILGVLGSILDPLFFPYKLRDIQIVNLDIISNHLTGHSQCIYITLHYYTAPYLSSLSPIEISCLKGLDSSVDLYMSSRDASIIYSSVKCVVFTLSNYMMINVKS